MVEVLAAFVGALAAGVAAYLVARKQRQWDHDADERRRRAEEAASRRAAEALAIGQLASTVEEMRREASRLARVDDAVRHEEARKLAQRVAALLDAPYSSRQATYDLRRPRRKGLIARRPHTQRWELTLGGQRVAVVFAKTHGRVLTPGLAVMDHRLPDDIATRSPLGVAWRQLQRTLDQFIDSGLAAA